MSRSHHFEEPRHRADPAVADGTGVAVRDRSLRINKRRRPMDRMLVVVFDNESKAYAGKEALKQLDGEGNINLYAYAVVTKGPDGFVRVKQGDDVGPIGTLLGTSIGSLI